MLKRLFGLEFFWRLIQQQTICFLIYKTDLVRLICKSMPIHREEIFVYIKPVQCKYYRVNFHWLCSCIILYSSTACNNIKGIIIIRSNFSLLQLVVIPKIINAWHVRLIWFTILSHTVVDTLQIALLAPNYPNH